MRYEKIYLEDHFPNLPKAKEKTQVTLYIPEVWKEVDTEQTFPCTVMCPGGSYWWCSEREAEPVALRMVGNGIAAAVVNYACEYQHYPLQLLEILAAITFMRRNSKKFHIDPEKIAVMGFSAGGHAACTAGLFWQEKLAEETLGIDVISQDIADSFPDPVDKFLVSVIAAGQKIIKIRAFRWRCWVVIIINYVCDENVRCWTHKLK